jgi:hypothetical protein
VNGQIPLIPVNSAFQPAVNPVDGIDPVNLPEKVVNGRCTPIYPHTFLQTNTVFDVASAAGLFTAWSDKHPAYEVVRGPDNTGANDMFTPEINNQNDPTAISVHATVAYDQLKVNAVLNQIDGKTVSVGEKLVNPVLSCQRNPTPSCDPSYFPGGYEPGTLKFTPQMEEALTFVDGAIGSVLQELRQEQLMSSTELIVSAKHGQSPIDPAKLQKIGDPITDPKSGILTRAGVSVGQNTEDDISLIWLTDQSQTGVAVAALRADKNGANTARIDTILSGPALAALYGDPGTNVRTPDIIVQPIEGTIYTHSAAKVAEHGGFAEDDTHVALIVLSSGNSQGGNSQGGNSQDGNSQGDHGTVVSSAVETRQIAPTILRFLGLDPKALKSVHLEGTTVLPSNS